jgi:DegV family protein with EDD domain
MVKISADSTCDLSVEIINRLDISIVPLNVVVGNDVYQDGVNIFPEDIVRFVDSEGAICRTASINVHEYRRHFDVLSKSKDDIVHVCLGSEFSSCYQNAVLASKEFDNVHVIDSRNLSTGSGHLVYEGALMAQNEAPTADILNMMKENINKIDASFVIDRLDYLVKGGRCSAFTAQSAKLLNIKPSIQVLDSEMHPGKKYRGSFERCVKNYVLDRIKDIDNLDTKRIFITHCLCHDEIVELARQLIAEHGNFEEIHITTTGSTITTHCGPKTLGIGLMRL